MVRPITPQTRQVDMTRRHMTTTTTPPRRPIGRADTLAVPHQVWKGKLDWRLLLGWLRDDG